MSKKDVHARVNATYTNRYEIKYLIEARAIPRIEAGLLDFLEPDSNNGDVRGYYNHSIYFDSHDFRYYREKREGELVRLKPRLRFYRSVLKDEPEAVFLELKGRYDRIVAKHRSAVGLGYAERLLADCLIAPNHDAVKSKALREFHYLAHRFCLKPCVSVLYHRMAYFGSFYPNIRVTFDRVVRCSRYTGVNIIENALRYALPPNQIVVELKYNDKIPRLLLKRLNYLGLQQVTLSKFAVAVERTHADILPRRFLHPSPLGISAY